MTRRPPVAALATLATLATLAAAVVAAGAAAAPPHAALTVSPTTVHRGGLVTVRGNAGACPVGDFVTIMSRAFRSRHEFAGVPSVGARVRAHHRFGTSVRIRRHIHVGRYGINARCGGGNFGITAHLHVVR